MEVGFIHGFFMGEGGISCMDLYNKNPNMKKRTMPLLRFLVFASIGIQIGLAQQPKVESSFPNDGTVNMSCYTELQLKVGFSSGATTLDPVSLTDESVSLFPKGKPRKALPLRQSYNPEQNTLTLTPGAVLTANTTYQLRLTAELADSRGYAFLPFELTFSTGTCETESPSVISADPQTVIQDFKAHEQGDSIRLEWESLEEVRMAFYYVQRTSMLDSQRTVALIPAEGKASKYEWIDTTSFPGKRTYVLLAEDEFGVVAASDTLIYFRDHLLLKKNVVYAGDSLQITFWSPHKTTAVAIMTTREGKQVLRRATFVPAGQFIWKIPLADAELEPSVYALSIRMEEDQRFFGVKVIP